MAKYFLLVSTILFICMPHKVHSRETGALGLAVKGGPSVSAGALWHFSQALAIRPMIELREMQTPSGDIFLADTNCGLSIALVKYLKTDSKLSPYFGVQPGIFWGRQARENQGNQKLILNSLLGFQYTVFKKVGVLGEIQFGYSPKNIRDLNSKRTGSYGFGFSNSGIGLVYYFD